MKNHKSLYAFAWILFVFAFLQVPVSAKDDWIRVNSKNFNLVGNASEKDIRKVATRLEQFRETFRQIFARANLNSPIPTNVVVFKSDASYKPFKPKRANGKIDNFVAGYFQPGEDVNYITLSTDGEDADTYGTIFHEYVHFVLDVNFGKSDVPPWFNEGLAEYYQTFEIEEDQKVKLGLPQGGHLALLQQTKLIPLDTLFKISNYSLQQNGNHSRSIFYAQSWALIHYLIQTGKSESLEKFILALTKNVPPEKAFQEAFQTTYTQMEKDLQKYVTQNTYKYLNLTFKAKLLFDSEMQTSPLSEAESNAYLGDLLYHTNRPDDAEPYLQKSLSNDPNSGMANIALGMVKLRQKKYGDAKIYLEKALSADQKNHLAYFRYAFLLSREDQAEDGFVTTFTAEKSQKMRDLLKKAIAINPGFTESYELYAFIGLVTGEQLEEGLKYMQTALKYQPGNQRYAIRIAELYLRQNKYPEAVAIAEKVIKTADDPQIKQQAERLSAQISRHQEMNAQQENYRKQFEEASKNSNQPVITRRMSNEGQPSPEELAKAQEDARMFGINELLRKPEANEKRVLGRIQKIECKGKEIKFTIKSDNELFTLSGKDFESLALAAFTIEAENTQIGCGENLSALNAVVTYKPEPNAKGTHRGVLVAVDLVPGNFRFVDISQPPIPANFEGGNPISTGENPPPVPANNQELMRDAIKSALRKLQPGEKRGLGFIEKVECSEKGMFFHIKTSMDTLMVSALAPMIIGFTPEIQQLRLGCSTKQIEVPVVFTFKDALDLKTGSYGELVSLEFVPRDFKLE
jgi:predicted Zn-dependent protease